MKPKRRTVVREEEPIVLPSNSWRFDQEEQYSEFQLKDVNIIQLPKPSTEFADLDFEQLEAAVSLDYVTPQFPVPKQPKIIKHVFDGQLVTQIVPVVAATAAVTAIKKREPDLQPVPTVAEVAQVLQDSEIIQDDKDPEEWLDELLG